MKYIESNTIELKEKISNSLCKEIVSFLNADGGYIYIGVKDDGKVIGVENIDESCRFIGDIITTQIEPNPQKLIKNELIFENDKTIIVIKINKGTDSLYCQKKYGYSSSGCTIRVGTTCREMTQNQIKNRYEKKFFNSDLLITSPSIFPNISFKTLKIYYSEKGFHLDENNFEANLFLKNKDGEYNKMAELLSDKNDIPLIFVKFNGNDKTSISQRSDYGNQCILFAYEQLKNRIVSENICLTDTTTRPRKDVYLFDFNCVNEALVNAIVHNDWSITEPLISFYNNRIEILSHGGLPHNQTIEKFLEGISIPRNEKLMRIFLNMGIVEHTDHGIPTILKKYGRNAFEINDNYVKVIIPFNNQVLKKQSIGLNVGLNVGLNMTHSEEEVIKILSENPNSTAETISSELSLSKRTIERIFSTLQEKGILKRIGSRKTGEWRILK